MEKLRSLLRSAVLALCAGSAAVPPAGAMPLALPQHGDSMLRVAGDCYAIGQQLAAENGGTLAKASEANRGGQAVCVIVVLLPGRDGQRPRRTEFVVPRN